MSRISEPRGVQHTTRARPRKSRPIVTNLSSRGCGSSIVTASGSSNTPTASLNATRCLARFARAFAGVPLKHHASIVCTSVHTRKSSDSTAEWPGPSRCVLARRLDTPDHDTRGSARARVPQQRCESVHATAWCRARSTGTLPPPGMRPGSARGRTRPTELRSSDKISGRFARHGACAVGREARPHAGRRRSLACSASQRSPCPAPHPLPRVRGSCGRRPRRRKRSSGGRFAARSSEWRSAARSSSTDSSSTSPRRRRASSSKWMAVVTAPPGAYRDVVLIGPFARAQPG